MCIVENSLSCFQFCLPELLPYQPCLITLPKSSPQPQGPHMWAVTNIVGFFFPLLFHLHSILLFGYFF